MENLPTETEQTICLILGGDLNLYLNPRVDKLDPLFDTNDNLNYRNETLSFSESENLVDIW